MATAQLHHPGSYAHLKSMENYVVHIIRRACFSDEKPASRSCSTTEVKPAQSRCSSGGGAEGKPASAGGGGADSWSSRNDAPRPSNTTDGPSVCRTPATRMLRSQDTAWEVLWYIEFTPHHTHPIASHSTYRDSALRPAALRSPPRPLSPHRQTPAARRRAA